MRICARIAAAATLCGGLLACGSTPGAVQVDPKSCVADRGIYGKVVDGTSGEPLWFVKVATSPATDDVRTDENGCFVIAEDRSKRPPELAAGRYDVVVDPPPGQVKRARGNEPVTEVYAQRRTGALEYAGEPLAVGTVELERISDGEGGEVIFTPSNLGRSRGTVDE